jgi:23S rRNA (adenine2503-C2)-methyltransferase
MIKNITDTDKCLKQLIKVCAPINCKVNLIQYNESEFTDYKASSIERIHSFFYKLNGSKIRAIIRKSKGNNISGACGQLTGTLKNKSGCHLLNG